MRAAHHRQRRRIQPAQPAPPEPPSPPPSARPARPARSTFFACHDPVPPRARCLYHPAPCPAATCSPRSARSRPATCRSRPAMSCTGSRSAIRAAGRCCSCTADRAPVPARCTAGSSIPSSGAWSSSISAAPVARVRWAAWRTTPPRTWCPTSRRCAGISAWSAGCCSAAPGAPRWRWPMPRRYPERVIGCVLRGVFLGRPAEVEWFLHGLAAIFPDAHAAFAGFLPEAERDDMLGGYLRRLTDPDPVGASAGGARLVDLRRLLQHAAAEPGDGQFVRAGPHGAGARAHRGALFRPQPVPAARGAARPHAPHRPACRRRSCRAATT